MDELILYSKANCPNCEMLKDNLKRCGVEFTEKRVDLDQDSRDFLIWQGHRTVPVMYRGGIHLKNLNDYMEVAI